jgi:hypothetical protein
VTFIFKNSCDQLFLIIALAVGFPSFLSFADAFNFFYDLVYSLFIDPEYWFLLIPCLYLSTFDFSLATVTPSMLERTEMNISRVITVNRRETSHRNFAFIF